MRANPPSIAATAWLTARYQAPLSGNRKALIPTILLLGAPLLIAAVSLVKGPTAGGSSFFFEMVHAYYLQFAVGVVMLGIGLGGFPADQANGTLIYLLTRPVPRSGIVIGKVLSACLTGILLVFLSATSAGLILKIDIAQIMRSWLGLGAAACYFGAFFTILPLVTRRAAAIGIVYVLLWEGFLSLLPGAIHTLTATHYIRALLPGNAAQHPALAILSAISKTPTILEAITRIVVTCLAITGIGILLFRKKEFLLSRSEET